MALDINVTETTQLSANRLKGFTPTVIGSIARLCAFGIAAVVLPAQSAMTRILPSPTITVSTIPANGNVNNAKQLGLELHNRNVRTKFPKIDPKPNRPSRTLASRVGRTKIRAY